jgi:hypothetical protein
MSLDVVNVQLRAGFSEALQGGRVVPNRQTHPSAILTPFQIVSTFGVPFLLAVHNDQIGLDAKLDVFVTGCDRV